MIIEHTAFNVKEPIKVAAWYEQNLGLRIVSAMKESPFMTFLADEKGGMIEIYNNPAAQVPDYNSKHHLELHLAFVSKNPTADKERLEKVGATFIEEQKFDDGTHVLMMKDPWGHSIQFCKRGKPFV